MKDGHLQDELTEDQRSDPQEPALHLVVNGVPRTLTGLSSPSPLSSVLDLLEMRPDRIAVEVNSEIAPRDQWTETSVQDGDRIEIVHFVGGGRE